ATTGAVGTFDYRVDGVPASVAIGQVFTVRQVISGTGNLNFLSFPELEVGGFRQVGQETQASTTPTRSGYRGELTRITSFRAEATGPYEFFSQPFLYYNPNQRRVEQIAPSVSSPPVTAVREPVVIPGFEQTVELFTPDEVAAVHRRIVFNEWTSYGWFMPGLVFLLVARLWRRPKAAGALLVFVASLWLVDASADRLPLEQIERGFARYSEGNLSMAIFEHENALRRAPDSAGLLHNLAILYFEAGDTPRSLYAAREAVRLAPRHPRIRTLPRTIEASVGIDRSIPPRHIVHPDVFFYFLAVAVNLLAILGGLTLRGRKGLVVLGQLILLIVVLASIAGVAITGSYFTRQLGVVRVEYDLHRIPERGADGWLVLPEGTAVEVLATQSGFVLVETALSLQGWVPIEQILWPENPMIDLIRYRGFASVGESDGS
ncbi:MAG: tetratricopeptide repeat protein, partial [Spirochaetales bacterium]